MGGEVVGLRKRGWAGARKGEGMGIVGRGGGGPRFFFLKN